LRWLHVRDLTLLICVDRVANLSPQPASADFVQPAVHRQRFQTDASVGSDIVTRFFTPGRSSILAYQA
jgi:hypothetical protein